MVHGASSLPTGCTCDAAVTCEKQVELGHTVVPNVRDESSDDHGTASVNVELTENVLASIHQLRRHWTESCTSWQSAVLRA